MLEHAVPAGISILIENHGSVSNDADWLVALMKEVNSKYDCVARLEGARRCSITWASWKTLPYAGGMSSETNRPELNRR